MCSFLTQLPKNIEDSFFTLAEERHIRTEAMSLICTRADLLNHYFNKDTFEENDATEMLSLYLNSCPVGQSSVLPDHHLLNLIKNSPEFLNDLTDLVNCIEYKGHRGLFMEKISADDHVSLLTEGLASKTYVCRRNSHFAYYVQYLAVVKNALDDCYLQTICSGGMLYSRGRKVHGEAKPGIEIKAGNLSSSLTYAKKEKPPYRDIKEGIDALYKKYGFSLM